MFRGADGPTANVEAAPRRTAPLLLPKGKTPREVRYDKTPAPVPDPVRLRATGKKLPPLPRRQNAAGARTLTGRTIESDMDKLNVTDRSVHSGDIRDGSILFIGTATVLIRFGGYTILTDPNFLHAGDHVHLGYGLVSTRLTNPALDIDALPTLDLVILSHYHGDHFDRVAARRLDRTVPIVTTPHAVARLRRDGFEALYALRRWRSIRVEKSGALPLRIQAMPGKHGPGLVSRLLPPIMGSLLEFGTGAPFRLYISGDTLIHDEFRKIPARTGRLHVALLHLGGTRVLGIYVTMDAQQGLEALRILDAKTTIPIHYNDYGVFKSPLEDFKAAVRRENLEEKVHYLSHGEAFEFRYEAEPTGTALRSGSGAQTRGGHPAARATRTTRPSVSDPSTP
jgi:L-ascorbate metabolism protein UlaG (beta-lactamase superfamily)